MLSSNKRKAARIAASCRSREDCASVQTSRAAVQLGGCSMAHPGLEFIQFGDFWGDRRSSYPNNIFDPSRPSQCRHQSQSPCGRRPPRVRDCPSSARRSISANSASQADLNAASSIPTCSMTSSLRTMIEPPPSTTAPIANSGWKGTPTLRTRIKSSGASSAAATSAATATPPRGSARIAGSSSLYRASATAHRLDVMVSNNCSVSSRMQVTHDYRKGLVPVFAALGAQLRMLKARRSGSRCFAVSRNDWPAAPGVAFKYRRTQSERLRRDAADPKVDARNGNGDENGIRPIRRAGKVGVIGVDPTPPGPQTRSRAAWPCRSM